MTQQCGVQLLYLHCQLLGISLLLVPDIQTRAISDQEAYPPIINRLGLGAEHGEPTVPQKANLAIALGRQGPDGL